MGVHGLWNILAPAGHTIPLNRLAGSTLAVDLSGWVCQAVFTKGLAQTVQKPHLRNLFFRVSTFYRLGANLVFVIDGEATQLKWATMDRRERQREGQEGGRRVRRMTGRRPHLQEYVTECCKLLDSLGVPYLQSRGEAEALCSVLNYTGVADGVLTNDSDAFLYGATTVYRDLTTDRSGHVECYTMKDIQDILALDRNDLVAMALLLGCDYCPEGVVGVGREKTLQFLKACKSHSPSRDVLDCFTQWRLGSVTEGDLQTKIEQSVFRKAMSSPEFPREEVIREFLRPPDSLDVNRAQVSTWTQPQLHSALVFCKDQMHWGDRYTKEKMVPLITQWAIREAIRGEKATLVSPSRVVKKCKQNGEACYHVQWKCVDKSSSKREVANVFSSENMMTIELQEAMEQAFPAVCLSYRERVSVETQAKIQQKNEAKALAKKHREEQRAAKEAKSPLKKPIPSSPTPTLPQIMYNMALTSPTHDSLKTSQPPASLHTLASPDNEPESPHKPSTEVENRASRCFSLHSVNVKRKLDLSGSIDLEGTAITGLHERLSAKGVDLQSTMQIASPNIVFIQEPPLSTHNSDLLLRVSTSSVPLTKHTGEALSLPSNPELSSPVSPAKQVRKPHHNTHSGYSPKKLALSNSNSRSPEKVLSVSSESEDELPLSERVINHQTSSTQAHSSHPRGTKDDPIVL